MNEKEKYMEKVKERLRNFDETLNEIKMKQKQWKDNSQEFNINDIIEKQRKAGTKLNEIEQTDESTWETIKREFDELIEDIGNDLRNAMSYFK